MLVRELKASLTRLHKVLSVQRNHSVVANTAAIPQPGAAVGGFFLLLVKGGVGGGIWRPSVEYG